MAEAAPALELTVCRVKWVTLRCLFSNVHISMPYQNRMSNILQKLETPNDVIDRVMGVCLAAREAPVSHSLLNVC